MPSGSQDNVEVVREGLRLFAAGELATSGPLWREDAWITGPEGWPETGPFHGREAVLAQFERLAADYDDHRFEDIGIVATAGDWVVARFTWVTRGSASGIETRFRMAAAYRIVDGRFAEAHFRWSDDEALEAAGLAG